MHTSALLLIAAAFAQDPEYSEQSFAEGEQVEEAVNELSAELGGILTTGNARFASMAGGIDASRKWSMNQLSLDAGVAYTRTAIDLDGDGVLNESEREQGWAEWAWSSQRYFAQTRYDRFLGEKSSLYAIAGVESDTLAGYQLRAQEQLGYSRVLVENEVFKLRAEAGMNYVQEEYIEGADLFNPDGLDYHYPAARGFLGAAWTLNENVKITDEIEVYENLRDFEDLRLYNIAALNSKLSDRFSLKLSHRIAFDNVPSNEAFAKLDQTTTLTFVASIF
ncbi:MAG: DUF481 domain-containing protein [Alphaproteobacteria bacterium]|nr:DUF481 domain-containing protein [Alphaproteobacteria bacterium]MCB9796906.1 DUF481 domain-containing protein [Alphaproteobacteria bacterium]